MANLRLLLTCLTVLSITCNATQLGFNYEQTGSDHVFSYQWEDFSLNAHRVTFTLNGDALKHLPVSQPNYQASVAQRYVMVEMLKAARQIDPRRARIAIREQGDTILLDVKSRSAGVESEVTTQLRNAQHTAFEQYLNAHYYSQFFTPYRQSAVKPDHLRYIAENITALIPLSQSFYEKVESRSDARAYFNLLLSWAQSIPYDTLEDRLETNGAGFVPPLSLLKQNKGDCDSKAVLVAAAARAFLPTTPMVLILLHDHALLGIALTPRRDEFTIETGGTRYILFDPTGPALMPFGKVTPDTQREIATGLYSAELIPSRVIKG